MAETTSEPPRKVALFSGHMIDAPGRKTPRFPSDKEPIAYHAIASALADLDIEPGRWRSYGVWDQLWGVQGCCLH